MVLKKKKGRIRKAQGTRLRAQGTGHRVKEWYAVRGVWYAEENKCY